MGFFSSPEDRKTLVLVEQLSVAMPTVIGHLASILSNQATLRESLNRFMSTVNTANATLAAQLQAAAQQITDTEAKIETDLSSMAATQSSALSDLRAALSGNGSSSIDPAIVAQLQAVQAKFETVDTTLQTLTAAAQAADPGAPAPVPVS